MHRELLGHGGVLAELTKVILERALDEELTNNRGDPAGRGSGNSRNGTSPKRVLTEIGAVDLIVPRDQDLALYAAGMSNRDIRKTQKSMYDVEVSPDLISRVTDGGRR